ncbi:unnamed protein product [Malus baccata var. baccata]
MAVFSTFLNCFMPSSQVSDEAIGSTSEKVPSSKKSKKNKSSKSSSSESPILVSYFPQNSYLSRFYRKYESQDK